MTLLCRFNVIFNHFVIHIYIYTITLLQDTHENQDLPYAVTNHIHRKNSPTSNIF